ncbi:MAG: hypothetical protein K2X76_15945 [Sphingomonas sp.]|nr:hypothetical protein [Sphingomonas sp.]
MRLLRLIACCLPLLLGSCLLSPGKFDATLTVNADRSFAFAYVGDVYAIDPTKPADKPGEKASETSATRPASFTQDDDDDTPDPEARNRALALALTREPGFRRVDYLGKGKFAIDYAIKGRLDHAFLWPFNLDAEVLFPFIVIELRPDGAVRMTAPGFANQSNRPGAEMMRDLGPSRLDGRFTLDTDAEIVSQNEESGVARAGGRSRVTWRATTALHQAPSAVLKLRAS